MKRSLFIVPVIYLIITFILLVLPGNEFPKSNFFSIKGLDKVVHAIMFFLLTWLFYLPVKKSGLNFSRKKMWFAIIPIVAIAYGTVMEFVQLLFVPFRSFEVADILVDSLGALSAYLLHGALTQSFLKKVGPDRNRGRNQN